MFVDQVKVHLRAGNGGAGVVAYQRTKGRPKGKPQGGNGGAGGDVIVEADPSVATLLRYQRQPHHRATDGTHGEGDLRHGRGGEDLVLSVPLGTMVIDDHGTVLADLVEPGHRLVAVRGGRGGRGNAAFVSPKLRAPAIAEQGEYGPEGWFTLELKLAADAALIGFPNAGKSTLISTVSAAKPKVADYPFTTLQPHLGVVSVDEREFVLADIPGLIEGAADGKGLGLEFLRHVERAQGPRDPARSLASAESAGRRATPDPAQRVGALPARAGRAAASGGRVEGRSARGRGGGPRRCRER